MRCHWLARSAIFLPSVSQVVLRNLVVSRSICEKVRPLRSAEMGKLGAANFKLRDYLFLLHHRTARYRITAKIASVQMRRFNLCADYFRSTPINGHHRTGPACLKRAKQRTSRSEQSTRTYDYCPSN
jgi:hypothetical protein